MLGEPENQFFLTRAALSTRGRAKSKFSNNFLSISNGGAGGGAVRIALYTYDSTSFDSGHITVLGGTIGGSEGTRYFGMPASRLDYERLGSELRLSWRTGLGASYQLQSPTNLPTTNWLNQGAPFLGTGGVQVTNLPVGPEPAKFFRLQVQ